MADSDKNGQLALFEELLAMLVKDSSITRDQLVTLYKTAQKIKKKKEKPENQSSPRAKSVPREAESAQLTLDWDGVSAEKSVPGAATGAAPEVTGTAAAGEAFAAIPEEPGYIDLPLDYVNAYAEDAQYAAVRADSPADALIVSLTTRGCVDMELIAHACGQPVKECIAALRGSIYRNPETWAQSYVRGFETADEYLSGDIMKKYRTAVAASETYPGLFTENIAALEQVMPPAIRAESIYATLGSPWIPPDVIDAFIDELLGRRERMYNDKQRRQTRYSPAENEWRIPYKRNYQNNIRATRTYGTQEMHAVEIIERTLNMRAVKLYTQVRSDAAKSGWARVINREATIEVAEKQQLILSKFRSWLFEEPARRERLEQIYDEQFAYIRPRHYKGDFLTMPGCNPAVTLYPYQKDAVARILFSPNTLLAHDVGAGKTYIMIAAGMELRRMGIARKNLYVVPNNIIGQWREQFQLLYPQATLLVITPPDFVTGKRERVLREIRDGEYDAVIMGYSSFELIHVSPAYQKRMIDRRIRELELERETVDRRERNTLDRQIEKLHEEAAEWEAQHLAAVQSGTVPLYFDDLGVQTLFLDEAHNYKNVPIDTKADSILGINKTGSKKCEMMMRKVQFVQEKNDGRGVVFATGTPITNSVTDMFVMQSYLQRGTLRFLNLHTFDNWAGMFGEKVTNFEIDVDAHGYRLTTRFARFHNLPELAALFRQIADFHKSDASSGLPQFDGYEDSVVKKSPEQEAYIRNIAQRAEVVRAGKINRRDDNMLKITTDGRKAALDVRLVEPAALSISSKVLRCAEEIYRIRQSAAAEPLTQLVFCDISVPKDAFNIYDELKRLLVLLGMDEREIAYVHEATTEARRRELFRRMNAGEIRLLIGSTFKLGIGVNVQDRLYAVHHIDVPWRPADMVQREGRILRQGNQNPKVRIFRYITDGSFDAYSWQLLETKQRFITQLLTNTVTERSGTDVDDTVLSYAEVKALAIGNPLIRERVEVYNELCRVRTLARRQEETRTELRTTLNGFPQRIKNAENVYETLRIDAAQYAAEKTEERTDRREIGAAVLAALAAHIMQPEEVVCMQYQGFDVVLPANMMEEAQGLWLRAAGRYYIEVGASDIGTVIRMDNLLEGLAERASNMGAHIENMRTRQREMEAELAHREDYTDRIGMLAKQLKKIDDKLGLNQADLTV